jgi:hypothetical protein
MKTGKHLICPSCRSTWVPVAPDAPDTAVLCSSCQPHPSRFLALFLCVLEAIRARLRWSVTAVWFALYLLSLASMGLVWWWR